MATKQVERRKARVRRTIKAAAGAAFSGRGRLFCLNHLGLKRAHPRAFSGKLVTVATRATGSVHRLVAGLE